MKAVRILITAGPTRESIDDVRYISNHSTGKMGFAIAEAALEAGAEVTLICGPVNMKCPENINRIDVVTAEEMYNETVKLFSKTDIAVLSAAVADYTPEIRYEGKLKKDNLGDSPNILLKKTKDILFELGKIKSSSQILVGFALESENLLENASKKLIQKNCDMIVANDANKPLSGFGGDYNTIAILTKDNNIEEFLPMTKAECAAVILSKANKLMNSQLNKNLTT
ncbi:MAG: phosphopantothenoylcysteine decarboxylase [Candidatus Kapabacteria bacterium]|nr:phosphopantothenoylcysteine decarboxylase [Candidatus Kapabacteria bacterium]